MSFSDETYWQIEQYLEGNLSGADLREFENRLENNPELANEVAAYRAINETVFLAKMGALATTVDADFDKAYKESGGVSSAKKYMLSLLGIGLLGVVGFIYIQHNKTPELNTSTPDSSGIEIHKPKEICDKKEEYTNPTELVLVEDASVKIDAILETPVQEVSKTKKETEENKEEAITNIVEPVTEVDTAEVSTFKIQEQKPTQVIPAKVVCPDSPLNINSKVQQPTLSVDNGSISIQGTIKGLGEDVKYRVEQSENFISENVFNELAPGTYQVEAIDENDCMVKSNTKIELKRTGCFDEVEEIFSPEYNQEWVLPIDENRSAKVRLLSLTGVVILEEEISREPSFTWDGYTATGDEAKLGEYYYELTYSNNETCIGNITLAR